MNRLKNKRAEGYVNSGVKILIAVVIGSLLLYALYGLMKDNIMSQVNRSVGNMFDYSKVNSNSGGDVTAYEDEGSYSFISKDEYSQYSSMTMRIENSGDRFLSFTVDGGKAPFGCDYVATESYFEVNMYRVVLDPGVHTFRVEFENGYAQTYINVPEN